MAKFHTGYMDEAVFSLSQVIDTAKQQLRYEDFDTMVGTGFSGGIVVPSLALALEKKFLLLRKETDDSHHGRGLPVGELGARWIFVDDFVASGRTRRRVMAKVEEIAAKYGYGVPTEMVGQYMYASGGGIFRPLSFSWTED